MTASNQLVIASDHAGYPLKETLKPFITSLGYEIVDLGTDSEASVDYPDYGHKMGHYIQEHPNMFGIVVCGSGIGISIAANRHAGVRCALCTSEEAATLSRQHNNANILALGARLTDENTAKACIKAFLQTEFEGGRHERRVEKLG